MTRPLKVGVQLPEVERVVRWPEQLAMARAIEDVGFDAVWIGDHLLYRWPWTVGVLDDARRDRRLDQPDHPWPAGRLNQLPCSGDARQAGGVRG
jgi:hypothetical protein